MKYGPISTARYVKARGYIPRPKGIKAAEAKGRADRLKGVPFTRCPLYSSLEKELAWKKGWEEQGLRMV